MLPREYVYLITCTARVNTLNISVANMKMKIKILENADKEKLEN